jgi:hypothetical protein
MISTKVFTLSRTELARMMSEEFIRKYWYFAVPVPVCGIFFLIFADGPLQALGMLMLLWPFSIPARSVVFTTKSSRLFTGGCHVEANPEEIAFIGEYNKDKKRLRFLISTNRIKEVTRRNGFLLVRLKTPALAPIREDAFETEADREEFLRMVENRKEELPLIS